MKKKLAAAVLVLSLAGSVVPAAEASAAGAPTVKSLQAQVAKLKQELKAADKEIAALKGSKSTPPTTAPGVQSSSSNKSHPPAGDVTVGSCTVDPTTHWPAAGLAITNHSSKSSDYQVQVGFFDSSGARVAEGDDLENNVPAGGTVKATAQGFATVTGNVVCKLVSVNRQAGLDN